MNGFLDNFSKLLKLLFFRISQKRYLCIATGENNSHLQAAKITNPLESRI